MSAEFDEHMLNTQTIRIPKFRIKWNVLMNTLLISIIIYLT